MSDKIKISTYSLYLNGRCYGKSTDSSYMTELFKDYVEIMDMYGSKETEFKVIKE